ncbi:unnamed protein product [Angiostrongylus costaricensis]|uniref:Uncharacterized protein n=1 Tax=Angiostrongylus costaricensis TaxID=334426 RepID=A0A0R3Q224_ANGCS|nr:unnamed protein product [Angiostrongylus costaricensis]
MVWEVFRPNNEVANGTATGTKPCHCQPSYCNLDNCFELFTEQSEYIKLTRRRKPPLIQESPKGAAHAGIDHILTNKRWFLLDPWLLSSFCSGFDHRLFREKIRFIGKREKNSVHRPRGKTLVVYGENILNESLFERDWQIEEYSNENWERVVEQHRCCSESASVTQAKDLDRI